jgi:hypothetical protein
MQTAYDLKSFPCTILREENFFPEDNVPIKNSKPAGKVICIALYICKVLYNDLYR